MSGVTWLASYPKSGSTWLRFICFHLRFGRPPADSREIDREINSRTDALADRGDAFVKTHAAAGALQSFFPLTARAIYVHRHPLDVLCSALNYDVLTGGADPDHLTRRSARAAWISAFLDSGGHPAWVEAPYLSGTWAENVASWRAPALPFPVLTLSFEGMLAEPDEAIRRIAGFIGAPCDEAVVAACRDATSFANLRALEEAELAAAEVSGSTLGRFSGEPRRRAAKRGLRFFNTGRAGTYKTELTREEIARGAEVFAPLAAELGYL